MKKTPQNLDGNQQTGEARLVFKATAQYLRTSLYGHSQISGPFGFFRTLRGRIKRISFADFVQENLLTADSSLEARDVHRHPQ